MTQICVQSLGHDWSGGGLTPKIISINTVCWQGGPWHKYHWNLNLNIVIVSRKCTQKVVGKVSANLPRCIRWPGWEDISQGPFNRPFPCPITSIAIRSPMEKIWISCVTVQFVHQNTLTETFVKKCCDWKDIDQRRHFVSFPWDDDGLSDAETGRKMIYRMMSYYNCKLSYRCTWQGPFSLMNIDNRAQMMNCFVICNFTSMPKFQQGLVMSWMSDYIFPHPVANDHLWLVKAPRWIRNVLDRRSGRCGCHCGISPTSHTRMFVSISSMRSRSINRITI